MCQRYKKDVINENAYKIIRLKEIIPQLDKKNIVIYGVGVNAKRALDCMSSLNILGLMDDEYTGKYIYGKRVLSQTEVQLMNVDIILIAATLNATQIIYERILPFCINNHIAILDIYGCDEILLHKKIVEQEIEYPDLEEEKLKNCINANEAIIFPFKDVLCSEVVSNEKLFYERMEKRLKMEGTSLCNFARKRMLAGKRFSGSNVNRKVIYEEVSKMILISENEAEYLEKTEEKMVLENLMPRIKMIELLEYAIKQGKDVYVYSDILDGDRIISSFFESYRIKKYKKILADPNTLTTILGTTIRILGEQYGYNKVFCFCAGISQQMIIPQLYNVNFQLVQGSLDTFLKVTGLQVDQDTIEHSLNRDDIIKKISETFDTPFLNQVECIAFDRAIAEETGWSGEKGHINPELLPVERLESTDAIEKISFPKSENPQVSIIISLCHRLEYAYNCLKAILLNTDNVTYEVIVADNGSHDFAKELEEVVSGITVIHTEEYRKCAKIYNAAAKEAKGTYLVFLSSDTQVQINWLYPLVRCIEMKENAALVGGKIINKDGTLDEAGGIVWDDGNVYKYGKDKNPAAPEYCYLREVDYISTVIMIKSEYWYQIGGFDETYLTECYLAADLGFCVRRRGKKVLYQPDSVVVHYNNTYENRSIEDKIHLEKERKIFLEKWKKEISEQQNSGVQNLLSAAERKLDRKTVLFVSEDVPAYDKDAGSRTIDFYIREFLERGYIVKFLPANFRKKQPYSYRLEQMGVEVLGGEYYRKTIINWICNNYRAIDFVFMNYPKASKMFIDIFKDFNIPVIYYGVDLHYLRLQREHELFGNRDKSEEVKLWYEKEAYLIKNSDAVYYPSLVETDIVKKEFHRSDAKQLMINIYDIGNMCNTYIPMERNGIMFIGSYGHAPNVDAVQWFSDCIFPQIYSRLNVPFYIAGSNMTEDKLGIAREGIKILGTLTDLELEGMYRKVRMIVVPLRYGAGIKGKVIEAMYHGIPTVTTSIGIEGIPNEEGAVKVVESEEDFAKKVIELYQSEEKLERMSAAGQDIIKKYYSRDAAWNNIAKDFS